MDSETQILKRLLSLSNHIPEVVLLKQSTESTNDDVRHLAQEGISTALVCSETQTQGRGQHQREWQSPQGNIYFSTLAQTNTPLDGRLALEVALNLLHMPCLCHLDLYIKWPNDLYSTEGKWGGILVEPISTHQAVVGIGINLFPHNSIKNLDQKTTSLTQLCHLNISRTEMISQIYIAVQNAVQWFNYGSQNLSERFNHVAMFKNKQVSFEHIQGVNIGIFKGIQSDGAVCIEENGKIHHFYQGRLRIMEDTL
jgi:BirA family transcriptional regulator, biotin operon repressor / biotin---[acetyl-CoA-carboxylase] ligase